MADKFGPFLPGSDARVAGRMARVTILSSSAASAPVAAPVTPHRCSTSGGATVSGVAKVAPPNVTLSRDGDRITQIRIECACGQIIDLSCGY